MNLEAAAKEYGIPAEGLTAAMEKRPSFLQRVAGEHTVYLKFVRTALCEQARGGKLVFHGHLGHLLLPGISHVIGVRVIADMEFRIQAAQREQSLTRQAAMAYIEKVDTERREWTRFLFEVDWDDPLLYDLILNLSRMSLETACETVVCLTERDEFQPTAASLRAMQDLTLQSRVSAALAKDSRTRAADLKVTANDGIVTITGTAPRELADTIPSVVRQVDAVKEVKCEVKQVSTISRIDLRA
jgi:cytidylate kinase